MQEQLHPRCYTWQVLLHPRCHTWQVRLHPRCHTWQVRPHPRCHTRQVRLLAMLSHKHIVGFRGAFSEPGHLCIALDYCAGGSL